MLATACAVAGVAHAVVPGMGWPSAFILGAIVSPTDAVAADVGGAELGVPRNAITILEGESLVNDATALVAYRMAVGAVARRAPSRSAMPCVSWLVAAGGGVAIGLRAGLGDGLAARADRAIPSSRIPSPC